MVIVRFLQVVVAVNEHKDVPAGDIVCTNTKSKRHILVIRVRAKGTIITFYIHS